jgi:hypothetical protein
MFSHTIRFSHARMFAESRTMRGGDMRDVDIISITDDGLPLAAALANDGIATLPYDRRGIDAASGD